MCEANNGSDRYLSAIWEFRKKSPNKWFDQENIVPALIGPKLKTGPPQGKDPSLQAGSFFLFYMNRNGPSNQKGDHIAPVLRIRRSQIRNKLQLFDTGAMSQGIPRPVGEQGLVPGSVSQNFMGQFEDPWATTVIPGPKNKPPNYGCGSIPPPSKLKDAVGEMKKAVPLGMARLVLTFDGEIIFATPLLDMHTGTVPGVPKGEHSCFSISRLLWSLRELPGREKMTAHWLIDIPRGDLAKKYLETNDISTKPLPEIAAGMNLAKPGTDLRFLIQDLSSAKDGRVMIVRRHNFDKGVTESYLGNEDKCKVHPEFCNNGQPDNAKWDKFYKELEILPPDRHTSPVVTLNNAFFDQERDDGNGRKIKLTYFKGRWPFPQQVTPNTAPLEGNTRISLEGDGFTDNSSVTVGGQRATDVRVARMGKLIYATVPAGREGNADIIIKTPGKEDTIISPGINYISDIAQTAQAALQSSILHLKELKERAGEMREAGSLTETERSMMQIEVDKAMGISHEVVDRRIAEGGEGDHTVLGEVYDMYLEHQHTLYQEIRDVMTEPAA